VTRIGWRWERLGLRELTLGRDCSEGLQHIRLRIYRNIVGGTEANCGSYDGADMELNAGGLMAEGRAVKRINFPKYKTKKRMRDGPVQ
jgi:hypothetical protein